MNIYEIIIEIIGKNGAVSIPSICTEVNLNPDYLLDSNRPLKQEQIKSLVSRKSDLFSLKNNVVSLLPEKELVSLIVRIAGNSGTWMKIDIDFIQKSFTYFEFKMGPSAPLKSDLLKSGDMNEIKREIYRLKIWDWESSYEQDGTVLEGTSWSTRLETKTRIYRSEGFQAFPKEWKKLCKALSTLVGKPVEMHKQ